MRKYLKFAVTGNQKTKAIKFGLKWDYTKKSWYTDDYDAYIIKKAADNQRIMKSQKKAELKRNNAWLYRNINYTT